jgi:hypothetical protein
VGGFDDRAPRHVIQVVGIAAAPQLHNPMRTVSIKRRSPSEVNAWCSPTLEESPLKA